MTHINNYIIMFLIFVLACNSSEDTNPITNNPSATNIPDVPLGGKIEGTDFMGKQAFVQKDTNFIEGRNEYRLFIYDDFSSENFNNPCYDNEFGKGQWHVFGILPLNEGEFDFGPNSSTNYNISFQKNDVNSFEVISTEGKISINNIDMNSRIMNLGVLASNSNGSFVEGVIDCEICLSKGEYDFQDQPLVVGLKGEILNISSGICIDETSFFQNNYRFILSESDFSGSCSDSLFFTKPSIVFALPNLDPDVQLLQSSSGLGAQNENIVIFYSEGNNSFRAPWGAIQVTELDTANGSLTVRIDGQGENGFNLNGNYEFDFCPQ